MVDMTDEAAITSMLFDVVDDPAMLARLSAETIARPLATCRDYAGDIAGAMMTHDASRAMI